MTDPHDERLALPVAQGALLWCIRMWVTQLRRGIAAEARIDDMLDQLGARSVSPHLQEFMLAISRGCTRMVEVQCVCRPLVCADERALLDVLSLAQAIRSFEARLILRGFVTPEAAGTALRCAENIGTILAEAGRFLPEPEEQVRLCALAPSLQVHPAHGTVH